MISNIQEVRDNADIIQTITSYVGLKKAGAVYKGLCPFHEENSPSFVVYPNTGRYKCFGCGESGDAVNFLMEHKGMTFPEAIETVAADAKVEIHYEKKERRPEWLSGEKARKERASKQAETLTLVANWLAENTTFKQVASLIEGKEPVFDVDGRVLRESTIKAFLISTYSNSLKLAQLGAWDTQILRETGMVKDGQYGEYDTFRNRTIFPIISNAGKVIGFGGRRPSSETNKEIPKYINSPDSEVYSKGKALFGLFQNKKGIHEKEYAILVEGYFDVITPFDSSVTNCVATCGTALTDDQARMLKRYTNDCVILRDGDEAGMKATLRDVETLIRAGLKVKVCFLEKGDPDDFVREHTGRGFIAFVEEKATDAIIWRVMKDYDKSDIYKVEQAIKMAAKLLSDVKSPTLRDEYIRILTKPDKLGNVAKSIKAEIADLKKETNPDLNPKQVQDIIKYGVYEKDNKYFKSFDSDSPGQEISNFTIEPIMHIIGAKAAYRLVALKNSYNHKMVLEINTNNFVEIGPFKKEVESKGNFLFRGRPEDFTRVKSKIYDEMPLAYPIYTMGLHKEGFWTWANGLCVENKFYPVDEFGVVAYKEMKYYLPAFSTLAEQIKSDDIDQNYEDEKFYVFTEGDPGISFKDWTWLLPQVYGENAFIAVGYYCASLFRDIVFERLDGMFPHLNFFGMPGTGKNQLAQSICAPFGKFRPPVHIVNATDAAFTRRISQMRNGIAWYDEYSNNIDHKRVEALKMFADGTGRAKAQMDNNQRTTSTPVNAACIISGQQQPTLDIALFTRCISLSFGIREFSATKDKHARLKALEKTGQLTSFTNMLQLHREYVKDNYFEEFDKQLIIFKKKIAEHGQIMDRIVRSYAALLTIVELLGKKVEFAFDINDMTTACINAIVQQKDAVYAEDEVSVWWRLIEYFISNNIIEHGVDILVEYAYSESYDLDWNSKFGKETKNYQPQKRLLYINFSKTHPEYLERHQRQRGVKGLDLKALQYYLKASETYEGMKKNKKFGHANKSCFVFDASLLPFDMEDSLVVMSRKFRRMDDDSVGDQPEDKDVNKDQTQMPF
jgi:DNA primase